MHAYLVFGYHLSMRVIHLAAMPFWRPMLACMAVAAASRLLGGTRSPRNAALTGSLAVIAGWLLLASPGWPLLAWPPPPVERLAGLGLIVLLDATLRMRVRAGGLASLLLLPASAASAAWWLRGAPLNGFGIASCMPVFLGLAAALPTARRLTRTDRGWATLAAAAALGASLQVTGASPHWARAALVPALTALTLLDIPAAMPALSGMVVMAAAAALVASDRGRLIPVDAACLTPLVAWVLVPRLAPRVSRFGPAIAGVMAAALGVALAWAARRALSGR